MYMHIYVCVCTCCRHVQVAEMHAIDSGCSLTLYFPMMSTLIIKNVGVITNDEYTRHLLYLLDVLLTARLQHRKTEVTSVSLCLQRTYTWNLFFLYFLHHLIVRNCHSIKGRCETTM